MSDLCGESEGGRRAKRGEETKPQIIELSKRHIVKL
jgi:hypothetical protein